MSYFVYVNNVFKAKQISQSQIAAPWGIIKSIEGKEGLIIAKLYANRLKRFIDQNKAAFYERKYLEF